jgi:hypothetical protein
MLDLRSRSPVFPELRSKSAFELRRRPQITQRLASTPDGDLSSSRISGFLNGGGAAGSGFSEFGINAAIVPRPGFLSLWRSGNSNDDDRLL